MAMLNNQRVYIVLTYQVLLVYWRVNRIGGSWHGGPPKPRVSTLKWSNDLDLKYPHDLGNFQIYTLSQ